MDLVAGGRIGSFVVDGHELLRTTGESVFHWGSYPMVPWAGRTRDAAFTFEGDATTCRSTSRRTRSMDDARPALAGRGRGRIATDLGPDWPFAGRAVQAFTLSADALTCRLELHADEVMPASIGWHPWFIRRPDGLADELELDFEAGAMYVRDAEGIATAELVTPPPGPWDDCFTDVRRPPAAALAGLPRAHDRVRVPRLGGLHGARGRPCVEPQTGPPDALNG